MANFKKAVEWLERDLKIKRPDFSKTEFIYLNGGTIPKFWNNNTNRWEWFTFDIDDYKADDWEIYKEE